MKAETLPPDKPARGPIERFRRWKDRVAALSRSPHAHAAMLGISVIDGSVFPIPPFAVLVPMVLTEPRRWARYATTGTLASLLGGLIGYGLGFGALRLVQGSDPRSSGFVGAMVGLALGLAGARWLAGRKGALPLLAGAVVGGGLGLLAVLGLAELSTRLAAPIVFAPLGIDTTLSDALTRNFWMLALLCSILPTPYKVVAIGSGFVGVGLPEFFLASVIGRTVRFFAIAGAFALFGEGARRWIKV